MGSALLLSQTLNPHQSQVSGFTVFFHQQNGVLKTPWILNYTGGFKISGKTVAGFAPYAGHVMVFPKDNPSLCVGSARTDDVTGTFTITNLAAGNYIVCAIDPSGTYRRVNYSVIAAVPM